MSKYVVGKQCIFELDIINPNLNELFDFLLSDEAFAYNLKFKDVPATNVIDFDQLQDIADEYANDLLEQVGVSGSLYDVIRALNIKMKFLVDSVKKCFDVNAFVEECSDCYYEVTLETNDGHFYFFDNH